ncbi:MAG: hypothetical protein JRI23_36720 [Deltaproteobacteria bacterium]|nr:hypothetical protein [Deltaproteobacteria bacterium]MBW2537914.1 hypothetical protein [Deltaproteobacteria bacterium]
MRWWAWLLAASLASFGCKSADSGQIAAAAITVGAAVAAAAINRAATDECWGSCTHGTMCDPDSGQCVPIPEIPGRQSQGQDRWYPCDPTRFECGPNEWLVCDDAGCEWYHCDESIEICDPRPAPGCNEGADCELLLAEQRAAPPAGVSVDPCRGLCLGGERCVVRDGVADCVSVTP